ncbi:hypothetical protein [Clostridium vincentii]|uniref:Pilus assembly protein, PilO n=1 Tax=Clostridium vincentii TaxID=52704 RepID=A0A2T0BC87_9CLOT|nr:hypothetical protein [Clostridium vincentii]PRR81455.1 hypothetical protein CLVI_24820 [Clostridium vincentii]
MKISKREKYLLGILATVLICFGYYNFIFSKQVDKLTEKRAARDAIVAEYDQAIQDISTLEKKKEKVETLTSTIAEKTLMFYPTIMQENTILEIDKFINDSELKANLAFNPIEVIALEELTADNEIQPESSLKQYTDQGATSATTETSSVEATSTSAVTTGPTCENFKIAINFTGSYDKLKKFILSLEEYNKKIVITAMTTSAKSESEITGTLNLEIFGIPKITDQDSEYLTWTLDNVYGKEVLFSKGSANGAFNSTIEEQNTESNVNDFSMMLRSPTSELPTLTLGKANDTSRETYVYEDNSKVEEVTVEFQEENGELYYKYNTSSSFYPSDNSSTGKKFTLNSTNIGFEITSEARLGDDDNSSVKLKIINNTTKEVNITVNDDDTANPRVSVSSEGGTVNVTNK